ncbi:hypothetical protein OG203_25600 [Nocardia sp. NBC_01499]|uniref:hypothetical protein n=1 Tax=Nocardia sp. NBC_01499 TaxID=2903597 RepID=UPI00386F7CE7
MSNTAGNTFIDRVYIRAMALVADDPKNQGLSASEVRDAVREKFLELVSVLEQVMPAHIVKLALAEFLQAHGYDIEAGQS